eukprot:comp11488_c0_seq1/m.5936 comp11488_c0_seq1/g.5936  ORF comp11488_c0_seq1/g.5936 comp11488_c0_seq1/m.5936 type:complete len:225 (-) comp11488_c0_seq1:208-882(-)
MEVVKLKPLTLTLVEYPEGDLIGKIFALISLAPLAIIPSVITATALRREVHAIYFCVGMVANEVLNLLLKNYLKEPRPRFPGVQHHGTYGKYGMPSNHTQFMFFFATFWSMSLLVRCRFQHSFWKLLGSTALIGSAALVGYTRVHLWYHTQEQVAVGAAAGAGFGLVWFIIGHYALRSVYRWVADLPICQWFLVKDSTDIDNVLVWEYTQHTRHQARTNQNKKK